MAKSLADRFWGKVCRGSGHECWIWTGALVPDGYGQVYVSPGIRRGAHAVAFFLTHARWSEMQVMHSCDNRRCVNPAHLSEGSNQDNARDMAAKGRHWNQAKTHCPSGHAYDAANTYVSKRNIRMCRACARDRYRRKVGLPINAPS